VPNFITIKVGPEPSRARFRLRDPAAFRAFLRSVFVESQTRELAAAR
jgi:hypothetical protein